jgi:hypothetical protein
MTTHIKSVTYADLTDDGIPGHRIGSDKTVWRGETPVTIYSNGAFNCKIDGKWTSRAVEPLFKKHFGPKSAAEIPAPVPEKKQEQTPVLITTAEGMLSDLPEKSDIVVTVEMVAFLQNVLMILLPSTDESWNDILYRLSAGYTMPTSIHTRLRNFILALDSSKSSLVGSSDDKIVFRSKDITTTLRQQMKICSSIAVRHMGRSKEVCIHECLKQMEDPKFSNSVRLLEHAMLPELKLVSSSELEKSVRPTSTIDLAWIELLYIQHLKAGSISDMRDALSHDKARAVEGENHAKVDACNLLLQLVQFLNAIKIREDVVAKQGNGVYMSYMKWHNAPLQKIEFPYRDLILKRNENVEAFLKVLADLTAMNGRISAFLPKPKMEEKAIPTPVTPVAAESLLTTVPATVPADKKPVGTGVNRSIHQAWKQHGPKMLEAIYAMQEAAETVKADGSAIPKDLEETLQSMETLATRLMTMNLK